MNILLVVSSLPYPEDSGMKIRNGAFIRELSKHHSVFLVALDRGEDIDRAVKALSPHTGKIFLYDGKRTQLRRALDMFRTVFSSIPYVASSCYSRELSSTIPKIVSEHSIDIVQLQEIYMASNICCQELSVPVVLDMPNCESDLLFRIAHTTSHLVRKWFHRWQGFKMRRFERSVLKEVDSILSVSTNDMALLRERSFTTPLSLIPNGVNLLERESVTLPSNRLIFTGSLHYPPNREGLLWFFRDIWPEIQSLHKEVTLDIIGRSPSLDLLAYASERVRFVTDCDDISVHYRNADIAIVPLLAGSGTRLKILESFAVGVPVVSTTCGAEGIEVTQSKDILLADTPQAFRSSILMLLEDREKAQGIADAAWNLVRAKYQWQDILKRALPVYEELTR